MNRTSTTETRRHGENLLNVKTNPEAKSKPKIEIRAEDSYRALLRFNARGFLP
jgi:hypothetical protein